MCCLMNFSEQNLERICSVLVHIWCQTKTYFYVNSAVLCVKKKRAVSHCVIFSTFLIFLLVTSADFLLRYWSRFNLFPESEWKRRIMTVIIILYISNALHNRHICSWFNFAHLYMEVEEKSIYFDVVSRNMAVRILQVFYHYWLEVFLYNFVALYSIFYCQ